MNEKKIRKENKVFSYRKWKPFWGLFADQHEEIRKVVKEHNDLGWNVIQFDWTSENFSLFRWVKIIVVTVLTLGFFVYWMGFVIIFEKEVIE